MQGATGRVKKLEWRSKKEVHEFFPDCEVPNAQLIRKEALLYLGTGGKLQAATGAVGYMLSSSRYWILVVVCLASAVLHIVIVMLRSPPPYIAVVNTLECAWYLGSNDTSGNYRAVPYALPPRPPGQTDVGPLKAAATSLLGRWRPPEVVTGLERCILAHGSSDCRFEGGVHMCSVRSSPRFCSHYRMARHTERHQVYSSLPPAVTAAPGSIRLPEAKQLGETYGEPAVSEDCLFLSIGRPRDYKSGYPIIAFVTGTGYVSETTRSLGQDSPLHHDDGLADRLQAVVVRIGYRLGFHGTFRQHGGAGVGAVNLGLADLLLGFEHLKKVADSFGGDPDRVTVVGHGSGAAMVMALLRHQRDTGKRLVHAAWLSSGPSRMPESGPEMANALNRIHTNTWANKTDLQLDCPVGSVIDCRREMESMEEGQLLAYLTANKDVQTAWTRTGNLLDWSFNFAPLTMRNSDPYRRPASPDLEWLVPDGIYLAGSPTEGDGLHVWDDVPVVFANVADHFEGFPGFRVTDPWKDNWQQVLKEVRDLGFAGSPDRLIQRLQRPDLSGGDLHGHLTAARAATLLRFTCPYRHLARRLASAPGRKSKVYHFVQQYSLKYPSKFLAIGDSKKLTGAFYGLDLLLMLGTAPQVTDSWDRRDQALMQHLQLALSQFAYSGQPPSDWLALNGEGKYTIVADLGGSIRSVPADDALLYCDTMQFDKYPKLRTIM